MSATEMQSGRGRLRMPGMGQTLADPQPEPSSSTAATGSTDRETAVATKATAPKAPRTPRAGSANGASGAEPTTQATSRGPSRTASTRTGKTLDGPYAGEKKTQVNPRVYPSIWSYYEDLVDELPRHQRHGALTALVNAVLAQHAPATGEDALHLIQWLRQAETRERPA